jgi:ABC-type lipoprotein release transport system permease subunit
MNRILGSEPEKELLAEAERLRPLRQRRHEPHLRVTLLVSAVVVVAALLVWLGASSGAA